jgi:hypothetical protein
MTDKNLQELSNDKLTAYKKAAANAPLAKDGDTTAGRILATARKRQKGVQAATKRLNEGAEGVSEGVVDAVKGLFGASKAQKASKAHAERAAARRQREKDGADGQKRWGHVEWNRDDKPGYKKEEVEHIDELNRDTLNSYHKKAEKDLDQRLPKVIKAHNSTSPLTDEDKKNAHKAHSRTIGTMRSHERLNKEAVEVPTHDEFKGDMGQSPHIDNQTALATKGQLKMMAMAKKAKYASHTNVEVPGTVVKEEAVVRKGDAVAPTSSELVPPDVPTKKNPKPFGNGAAKPTAPEPMKGITCKEEVLDEISDKTLKSYDMKSKSGEKNAIDALQMARKHGASDSSLDHVNRKITNRQNGQDRAAARLNKEEVELIDELNKDTLHSYKKKSDADFNSRGKTLDKDYKKATATPAANANAHKMIKRLEGSDRAVSRLKKEEAGQIDELSSGTIGSYIKKASSAAAHAGKGEGSSGESHLKKQYGADKNKRLSGIHKAVSRLTKEETEQIDELSNEKLGQYKKAAGADASAADKAGNFARGNKRFSGIVKATKKQFANDTKKEDTLISFNDFIKEEKLNEGLRLVATHGVHGAGSKSAKVYKNNEFGEYQVKHYTNGEHHKDADYHTDDKQDANETAKKHVTSKNN